MNTRPADIVVRTKAELVTNVRGGHGLSPSTFDKGLGVLEALAMAPGSRGLTLTELSQRLGMHRSTVFRFLATLQGRGYIDRDPATNSYRLGVQVLLLAATWLNDLDIRRVAKPVLQTLCDQSQELVHLTILDHGDVVTIDRIEGRQPVSLQTGIGNRRPAHCTASGKAILAYLPAGEVEPILAAGLAAMTAETVTSPETLRRQLAEIRERGYAIDRGEHFEGVCCVAAPVFGYERTVVASISIAGPAPRMADERLAHLGEEVWRAATTVSRQLGATGQDTNGHSSEPNLVYHAAR